MCIQILPFAVVKYLWSNNFVFRAFIFVYRPPKLIIAKLQIRKCAFNIIYLHEFQHMCIQFSTISWVNACWAIQFRFAAIDLVGLHFIHYYELTNTCTKHSYSCIFIHDYNIYYRPTCVRTIITIGFPGQFRKLRHPNS